MQNIHRCTTHLSQDHPKCHPPYARPRSSTPHFGSISITPFIIIIIITQNNSTIPCAGRYAYDYMLCVHDVGFPTLNSHTPHSQPSLVQFQFVMTHDMFKYGIVLWTPKRLSPPTDNLYFFIVFQNKWEGEKNVRDKWHLRDGGKITAK